MGLAHLEYLDRIGGELRFAVDAGTNRFYAFAVGDGRQPEMVEGFRVLGDRSYESALLGPLTPATRGRAVLAVPAELFDRDHGHVQLTTFKEEDMRGPALSDIVLPPRGGDSHVGLDPIAFGAQPPRVGVVAFRDEARPVSTAMFLDMLAGLLPKLLPMVGPLLGGLFGGGGGSQAAAPAGAAPTAPGPDVLANLGRPETARLITDLVQALLGPGTPAATRSPGPSAVSPTPPLAPAGASALALQTPARKGRSGRNRPSPGRRSRPMREVRNGLALSKGRPPAAMAFDSTAHLSNAMIFPALLAALPALMPLLQQVLTPETIKTVLQTADPTKVLGVVTGALKDFGAIGAQIEKQELDHLERLNPGTANPDLVALLNAMDSPMSLATAFSDSQPKGTPGFKRVTGVSLQFADLAPQRLAGRDQVCFRSDGEIGLPLTIESPRPLRRALLGLRLKDPASLRVLYERSDPLEEVSTGRLAVVPTIPRDRVARLEPGREYLACVSVSWPGKKGRRLGTSMSQLISVTGRVAFDRVEPSTELIPLANVDAHREFWHKAWQGTFSAESRRVVFNCKYHYALDPSANENAQMATETETDDANGLHEVGRLKSGLALALPVLNALLPRISPHPELDADSLAALRSPDFVERYAQAARTQVSLRGRPGDSAALWVFPEVKLQSVVLRDADAVSPTGQVLHFGERRVAFPFPALAHVIGVASR